MSDKLYVEKTRYDALLSAFGKVKLENESLHEFVDAVKAKTEALDGDFIKDIRRFMPNSATNQPEQEVMYTIGAFTAMAVLKNSIDELEETMWQRKGH